MTDTPLTAEEIDELEMMVEGASISPASKPPSVGKWLATIAALTERAEQAEAELDLSQTTIYAMNKGHRPDFGPYEDPGYFGDYFRDLTGVGNWGPDEPNEKLRSKVIIGIGMAYTLLEPQRARDVGGLLIERAARAEGKDWAVIQREKLDAEKAFTEGAESVLLIRCMEHREVPAYNSKEITGAECAACKVVEMEARVAELTAALTEQGLLQKKADGSMVWHVHDCPASFDFAQCNYRCRVARAALEGTH